MRVVNGLRDTPYHDPQSPVDWASLEAEGGTAAPAGASTAWSASVARAVPIPAAPPQLDAELQAASDALLEVADLYAVPRDYSTAWVQDRIARGRDAGLSEEAITLGLAGPWGLAQQISSAWAFDRAQQRAAADAQRAAEQARMQQQNEAQTRQMADAMVAAQAAAASAAPQQPHAKYQAASEAILEAAGLYGVPRDYSAAWVRDRIARGVDAGLSDKSIALDLAGSLGLGQQISMAWDFDQSRQRAQADPRWAAEQQQMQQHNEAQTRQIADAMAAAEAAAQAAAAQAAAEAAAQAQAQANAAAAIAAQTASTLAASNITLLAPPPPAFPAAFPAATPSAPAAPQPTAPAVGAYAAVPTVVPVAAAPTVPVIAALPSTAVHPASRPAAVAAPATRSVSSAGYGGEPAIDPAWLRMRQATIDALRPAYLAARDQAAATLGAFWSVASTSTDETGQVFSTDGSPMVFVPDPESPHAIVGYSEDGNPVYLLGRDEDGTAVYRPNGRWMQFDQTRFDQAWFAADGAPMQQLAAVYGTDAASLLARYPDLWTLVAFPQAINAGPAPHGEAMIDAASIGYLDLYMDDPLMGALITAYGGTPAPATRGLAPEQARLYGQRRYAQLSRLADAMKTLRHLYVDAMNQARGNGGVGWVERERSVSVFDEQTGMRVDQPQYVLDDSGLPVRDANGQPQVATEHVFDPDTFTAWYESQQGLQYQAFKSLYGASRTQFDQDEYGNTFVSSIAFANPHWAINLVSDGVMRMGALTGIDLNHPPELIDRTAVGFDLEVGWATPPENLKQETDWLWMGLGLGMVAVVAWYSGGTLGPEAVAALGLTGATAVVAAAAIASAATSLVSGIINGNLSLKSVLVSAVSGALTAGLGGLTGASGALGVVQNTLVQGGIQALLGGKFEGGALAGFFSSLGSMISSNMEAGIEQALGSQAISAEQAFAGKAFARVLGSAFKTLGHPGDPSYAFASSLVDSALQGIDLRAIDTSTVYHDGDIGRSEIVVGAPAPPVVYVPPVADNGGFGGSSTGNVGGYPGVQVASNDDGAAVNALPVPGSGQDRSFTNNNGDIVNAQTGATVGRLTPEPDAPQLPQGVLPGGVTSGQVSAFTDEAGKRWYVINGLAYEPKLFMASAQGIVDQGLEGLQSGAVTPSQYLQAVRFVDGNDASAPSPANSPSSPVVPPPVVVVTSAQDRQQAILQDQVLQAELRQQGMTPIDPDRFTGPLTQAQADLLTRTGYLFNDADAARVSQLRDQGQLFSLPGTSVTVRGSSVTVGAAGVTAVVTVEGGAGAAEVMPWLRTVAWVLTSPTPKAGAWALLFAMPNATVQYTDVDMGVRFTTRPGETYGTLERQQPNGDWTTDGQLIRPDQISQSAMLTPEERARFGAPAIYVPPPPPGGVLATPIPTPGQLNPSVPGYDANAPQMPTTETYPAEPQMNWEDLITESSNSKKLGNALRATDIKPPVDADGNEILGYEAHHIVPDTAGGPDMADLRAKLRGMSIDLDGKDNGVWLPGPSSPDDALGAYHRRLNNDVYNKAVLKAFEEVNDASEVMATLAAIAEKLRAGTFPGVRLRP